MPFTTLLSIGAQAEFNAARTSFLHDLAMILTGGQRTLLPLKDVVRAAGMDGQVDRGVHEIPLALIRGTENRTGDFDASFRPLDGHLRDRWIRLYELIQSGRELPPIAVYRVGDVYFVKDGHHRVSIARQLGWESIRAHVVEIKTRAPLGADVDAADLLQVAEYADFLRRTQLDRTRPEARLQCSQLGRYDVILEHILGHRYFLSADRGHEVPVPEAAASWYDLVYRPVMAVAEQHRIAEQLPDWTETDIYLALTRLWLDLDQEGQPAGPEPAAEALMTQAEPHAASGSARGAHGRRRRLVWGSGPRARRLLMRAIGRRRRR